MQATNMTRSMSLEAIGLHNLAYQAKVNELTARFHENFVQFEGEAPAAVKAAGPRA
jgi:hypothetical protein